MEIGVMVALRDREGVLEEAETLLRARIFE